MLLGGPLIQIIQQFFQLAVVGGGQAGQAQLLIAGVGAQILCRLIQQAGIPLAHGAVQEARLTEPAAAHTAAQHFNAGAILDGTHHGHNKVRWRSKLVQILDDGLGDDRRDARLVGGNGFDPAVLKVGHIVEGGDIDPGDLCNAAQQLLFGDTALFLGALDLGADGRQLVLTLTQLDDIKEIRNGLRVAGAGTARHDQGPVLVAVLCVERNVSQIEHGQNVGVGKLVL